MIKVDVAVIVYTRIYELARLLDMKDFKPRIEELLYILEKVKALPNE